MALGEQFVVTLYKNVHSDDAPPLGIKLAKLLKDGQPILCVQKVEKAGYITNWNMGWNNTKVKVGDVLLSYRASSCGLTKADNFDSQASVMKLVRYFNGREDTYLTFQRGEPANCKLERAPTTLELRKLVGDGRSGFANPGETTGDGGKIDFRPTARTGDPLGDDGTPFWWGVSPAMGRNALFSMDKEGVKVMQELFDLTWKEVTTRDRAYEKPRRLKVKDVERNCNPAFWQKYVQYRKQARTYADTLKRYEAKTTPVFQKASKLFGELDASVNEFYLLHGTKPSAAESIAQSDFLVSLAGSHAGTLYGKGVYFAESCTKSDEYASRYESDTYCILLCRVVMGRIFYSDSVKPERDAITTACCTEKTHDGCLGDREKCRGTFREFIVYESDAVYPECIIYYTHQTADVPPPQTNDSNAASNSPAAATDFTNAMDTNATVGVASSPPTGSAAKRTSSTAKGTVKSRQSSSKAPAKKGAAASGKVQAVQPKKGAFFAL